MNIQRYYLDKKILSLVVYYFLVTILLMVVTLYGETVVFKNNSVFLLVAYFWIISLGIYFLIYLLRYLTYNIIIDKHTLIERGIFSKKRVLEIKDVKQIYAQTFSDTFILRTWGLHAVIPHFNFTNNKSNPFPSYPISHNLLKEVHKIKPDLLFDFHIAELDNAYNKSWFYRLLYIGCYFSFFGFAFVLAWLPMVPFVIYNNLIQIINY